MYEKKTFKRWYDHDNRLKELVETLERLTLYSQQLFGAMIFEFPEMLLKKEKKNILLENLSLPKIKGLWKSKGKRRWYDQDPIVHRALNMLYSLSSEHRVNVAKKFLTSAQIVRGYELTCLRQKSEPETEKIEEIIEVCFSKGRREAKNIFNDYVLEYSTIYGEQETSS